MMRQNQQWENELTNLEPAVAIETLKNHLFQVLHEKESALQQVENLTRKLNEMRTEAESHRKVVAQLVTEKVQTEAAHTDLLLNVNESLARLKKESPKGGDTVVADVRRLEEQLAESNVMADAQKETITKLLEENKRLRSQNVDTERVVTAYENLQRENRELKRQLSAAGGEEVAMLADFLQENGDFLLEDNEA